MNQLHAFPRPGRKLRTRPGGGLDAANRRLGEILIASGALDPGDLLKALALQQRQNLRLGDILLAHGMVGEGDLLAALSEQFGARIYDPGAMPADPSLVTAMGALDCLHDCAVPVRRLGAATIIASARPEKFGDLQARLPKAFGTPLLAICNEQTVRDVVLAAAGREMALRAETRVSHELSCRLWYGHKPRRLLAFLCIALLAMAILSPAWFVGGLMAWAVATLAATTAIKALAAWTTWKDPVTHRTDPDPPIKRLPQRLQKVSLLVPLLREDRIAGTLIARLSRLNYPKELLDVILIVEEDDRITQATLDRTHLPHWMRRLTVPRGGLKTKPRAMNFALDFCRGDIIGVYDAEDAPAPDQIHRIVERFNAAPPDVGCLQGILDFYNTRANWFSRCFTIEYASWFRVVLPGYQRLGLVIPLGGTTLFFRREVLEKLGGWDAHNVTEDADLGVRLARFGYRAELVQTVTEEEANCRPWPWVKQRSRWLKGYAMTWSAHMRHPLRLWRDLGPRRFFGFQLLFLGTLSQFFLVPLLWSCWLLVLGLPHPLAGVLPGWVYYAAGGFFLLAEVVNILIGMMGATLTGKPHLRRWVPTLHIYYPLAAIATYKALVEMILRPFYWDKTDHGVVPADEPVQTSLP